tara:strand:- start:853 stop:1302 length:450 start_codon:yes stop_codon:yes gene_type:complete
MFLKKIIIPISILLISSNAIAQTTTSTAGKFTQLDKGEEAPFSGTLFDPQAVAKIIADKKYAKKDCEFKIKYEKDLKDAKCIRDTKLLKSELEIEKNKFNLIVAAQKEEIETLRNLAKGSDSTLWAAIGFALGAASSIAIFYAATEIAK